MIEVSFLLFVPLIATVVMLTSHLLDSIPALNGQAHSDWEFF